MAGMYNSSGGRNDPGENGEKKKSSSSNRGGKKGFLKSPRLDYYGNLVPPNSKAPEGFYNSWREMGVNARTGLPFGEYRHVSKPGYALKKLQEENKEWEESAKLKAELAYNKAYNEGMVKMLAAIEQAKKKLRQERKMARVAGRGSNGPPVPQNVIDLCDDDDDDKPVAKKQRIVVAGNRDLVEIGVVGVAASASAPLVVDYNKAWETQPLCVLPNK